MQTDSPVGGEKGVRVNCGEPVTIQGLEVDMHNGTVVQVSPTGYRSLILTFPYVVGSMRGGLHCTQYGVRSGG